MAPPESPDGRSASMSNAALGNATAKESCEKAAASLVTSTAARDSRLLNAWYKKNGATRSTPSAKATATSSSDASVPAGVSEKSETRALVKQTFSADATNNSVISAAATGSFTSSTPCKSVTSNTTPSEQSNQQNADAKHARRTGSGELTVNRFEASATLLKNASEVHDDSEAGSLVTAALTPTSSAPKPRKSAANPEDHLALHSELQPAATHEGLLKSLSSPANDSGLKSTNCAGSKTGTNSSTDRSCSSSSNFDNMTTEKGIKALSAGAVEGPSATDVCGFFDLKGVEAASMENLAAKLRSFSFQKAAISSNGAVLSNSSNASGQSLNTNTAAVFNSGNDGDLGRANTNVLLTGSNWKSGYMFPADAVSGMQSSAQVNSATQLKETLFATQKSNMVLSTVLKEPAYTAAALAARDLTAAELALAFPSEHSRHQRTSRDCAFDGATGASVIAAAAVLAQPESRPLLLTRFEMLEAYAKGRLCLSCDSKSHRMPSCPYGEFVCPNCHRSSHRGEECPLRCRFCQTLHVGISVTVCIKRFRSPLEALLGIPLPLRDLQPASLLSSGSPLSPFGPAACTRPNSAFGRSVYLSNLPPNTTQEAVAAAVESLVTKGRLMQVDLHEKHAFVQLSTLEAAFELVDKRRQLQIRGVTLKVQFKKTGVFNNSLLQGAAGGGFAGGVLHPSGSSSGSGFSLSSSSGCGSNNGGSHLSTSTPLSAASSSPVVGAFNGCEAASTPKVSPSLNSLLTFLGPPAAPYVSEICAQVAAKLREDLQLGLVSAQQPPMSLLSSGSIGVQQRVGGGGDTMQIKQQLRAQTSFDDGLATPLTNSLLSMAVGSSSSNNSASAMFNKSMGSGADAMAEISTAAAAAAAAANTSEGSASALLSCGAHQNNKGRVLGSETVQSRGHLPYVDAAIASAAALLQQQQLLALSRQQQQQQQQKTSNAVSTEKLLLQLLQQQHIEQQQQQQLAHQQQQQQHRFGLGAREDHPSSASSPAQELLLTETLMRAAAAAAAGRCVQGASDRNSNEEYNARRQVVQMQLQQQEEQLQDLQQQRQQRLLQLSCAASSDGGTLLGAAASQEQQLHQRARQTPDLRDLMGLSHFPMYSEALGKPLSTDSLAALGLTSSQSDVSLDHYTAAAAAAAEGSSPGSRNKTGSSSSPNPNSSSSSSARNTGSNGSGFDLQFLLSEKNKYNDVSTSAASLQPCYSRTDAYSTPSHYNMKSSSNASSTDGNVAFTSLQHPWNDLAAAAATAVPAVSGGRLSGLSSTSLSSSHPQQHQQKDTRMRLQELQQQSLAHSSSSTPLSTTTTFAEGDSIYKRLSPHHLVDGPSTMSTDSGSRLPSSTAARLVAAVDDKHRYVGSGSSSSSSSKHLINSKGLQATKGMQQLHQPDHLGFAAAAAAYAAETGAAGPIASAPSHENRYFHDAKKLMSSESLTDTPHSNNAQELTAAAAANSSSTNASGTVVVGEGRVAAAAAASSSSSSSSSASPKGQAAQQLLDVAAVLMRKAMEETPDVEELARQLYHATQDLPQETVQQLLLTLASNGWGGAAAAVTEEEDDEEEEEGRDSPSSKAKGGRNSPRSSPLLL